ncbi:MAG: DUF503 domain-containing protein [Deltaproteobacteria bacterium]|nr:DUF503 domain-containing protein [Candidatus Anaeroferrophillacea bacterium]
MHVGICRVELLLPGNRSLKGKRRALKSIIQRLKNTFNVAVAEIAAHDLLQRAEIGICTVGSDQAFVNRVLDKVLDYIEGDASLVAGAAEIEIIPCGHFDANGY